MSTFDTECLIEKSTGFQYAKPNCIDLILTNKKELCKNSNVLRLECLIIIVSLLRH